jgi:hypothetical protein
MHPRLERSRHFGQGVCTIFAKNPGSPLSELHFRPKGHTVRSWIRCLLLTQILVVLVFPAGALGNTIHYVRPDGTLFSSHPWQVTGASSAWEAIDDNVSELEVPSSTDYIGISSRGETRVSLGSMNIRGVAVVKAQIWYYAPNSQPFEVKSATDVAWQSSNSSGWHSLTQTISTQSALDNFAIYFRTEGSSGTPREVRAAFLKLETNGPKVYWGAWMDGDVYKSTNPGLTDAPWDATTWSLFESHAQKATSIVHFGQPTPWQQEFSAIPFELSKANGSLPLMDMGTGCKLGKVCKSGESPEEEEVNRASLTEISEGKYDSYFKAWAEAAAKYKYPFFLRWAWEMNGTWFKWGRDAAKAPSNYVSAWRHIHEIAVAAGATNITWVWCPNVQFSGSTSLSSLYPGDAYVDWTCLDGYNRENQQFPELFGSSYESLTATIAPSKPVVVGETATVDGAGHLSQGEWITTALSSLSSSFPRIKAFVWFNWNIVENGKEWPWPIESTAFGQSRFAAEIASPYFARDEFASPPALKPIQPLP